MLAIDVTWQLKSGRLPFPTRLTVSNSGGGRIADYTIVAHDCIGSPLYDCKLLGYPRWSEPISGLVARSISRLQSELALEPSGARISGAFVRSALLPGGDSRKARTLATLALENYDGHASATLCEEAVPAATRYFKLSAATVGPLQLLVVCFAQALWKRDDIPAVSPRAHDLPQFRHGDRTYIRASDIPAWAATPFKRSAAAYEVHLRSEREPCYDARAWEAFLGPQAIETECR